jgi:glycosyltransferase involved in cell wall biosynthesis
MKPLITALVDTYNHEKYIEQALVSVLEQGFSPSELEIIVVDDGSTDKTPDTVQKFTPRVKHLRKKNGGQASAFNAGFAETRGELVTILDGDDWWAQGKLNAVAEVLEKNPEAAAVGHGYYEFHEESGESKIHVPGEPRIDLSSVEAVRAAFRNWRFLLMGALTVRRKVLERVMPLPVAMTFSADNPIQFAAMAAGALLLEQPLSYYRIHGQNLYEIRSEDAAKLRRKYEMMDFVLSYTYRMLLKLGVAEECVSELLSDYWLQTRRTRLRQFGGKRVHTLQAEMRSFQLTCRNPSVAYRFYKYAIMGAATLVLPPRQFYRVKDWYARKQMGRYRDLVFKAEVAPPTLPEKPSERI